MKRVHLAVLAAVVAAGTAVGVGQPVSRSGPPTAPAAGVYTAPGPRPPTAAAVRGDAAPARVDAVVARYFTGAAASSYGGSYLDDAGRTVVLVTGGRARARAELVALLGSDARWLTAREARFPLTDLNRVLDHLTGQVPALHAAGVQVAVVALDEQANRVWVGLESDTPRARQAVLARLAPADRALVALEATEPPVLF